MRMFFLFGNWDVQIRIFRTNIYQVPRSLSDKDAYLGDWIRYISSSQVTPIALQRWNWNTELTLILFLSFAWSSFSFLVGFSTGAKLGINAQRYVQRCPIMCSTNCTLRGRMAMKSSSICFMSRRHEEEKRGGKKNA